MVNKKMELYTVRKKDENGKCNENCIFSFAYHLSEERRCDNCQWSGAIF